MVARSIAGPAMRVRGPEKSYGNLEVLRGNGAAVALPCPVPEGQ
ncbi:hypothetical protein [Streptomyces sp. NPDC005538]